MAAELQIDLTKASMSATSAAVAYLLRVESDMRTFGRLRQIKEGFGGGTVRLHSLSLERLEEIRAIAVEHGCAASVFSLKTSRRSV